MTNTLTRDERQLLVAVSKHRRAHDWLPTREGFRHNDTLLAVDWHWPWRADNKTGRTFRIRLLYPTGAPQQTILAADVDSIQEAVDVAVLYGLLPLAFSSAYRAGLDAAQAVLNRIGRETTCPAHGEHPHNGMTCLDCPTCRPVFQGVHGD